jgi:glycosyltransferase involved in cell wall biosynthesis
VNILLVSETFNLDGITRHLRDLSEGLVREGHTVFIAATPSMETKKLAAEVRFIPLSLCAGQSYRKRFRGIIPSLNTLVRTIKKERIDIVHTHKRYADYLGRIAVRATHCKHISTCHNEFTGYRLFSVFGDVTIAPSEEIAAMLKNTFGVAEERIRIVAHGMKPLAKHSLEAQNKYRSEIGVPQDAQVILSVGHLNPQKNRATLIEALHFLKHQGKLKHAVCLIVGEGEEHGKIQRLIRKYDLQPEVRIMPADSDIAQLNNIANFAVLSSVHEAMPQVILEAASIGKAHVATSVGFIPSFIGANEAGICVPPQNPEKLAEGISFLLANPDAAARMGETARERFTRFHDYDSFIRNTLRIYTDVLSPEPV